MTDDSTVDYRHVTGVQKETWGKGDFNVIALTTMEIGEDLVRAVDPLAGQKVLDVACGSGNVALIAARRHCDVLGIDYVPELIDRAKMRADSEGTFADFQVGDAQELPFSDESFDVVFSVFGVMFAPNQEKTANEIIRVCKKGSIIAMANWMPERFGGDFFRAITKHVPPPPGLKPPVRWGMEDGLKELFGNKIKIIRNEKKRSYAYFRSIEHAVELFSEYFGPIVRALEAAKDEQAREAIKKDVAEVFSKYNKASDGTAKLEYEYMQTIAKRT